jgi:crossover junction endodeoxyribonuclease RuvC
VIESAFAINAFAGVDPSLTATGLALHGGGLELDAIRVKSKGLDRLRLLRDHVVGFCLPASLVAIEGYAYGAKFNRESMGELGGILRLALYEAGIDFIDVPPTVLKKFVTGKGNAQKQQMLLSVYKKWGVDITDDNIADAYALARFAEAYAANPAAYPDVSRVEGARKNQPKESTK